MRRERKESVVLAALPEKREALESRAKGSCQSELSHSAKKRRTT